MATPNYVITENFSFYMGSNSESCILEAWSFVRPIETAYLPTHVLQDPAWKGFNTVKDTFCYCRYGIVPIPRKIVRLA